MGVIVLLGQKKEMFFAENLKSETELIGEEGRIKRKAFQ